MNKMLLVFSHRLSEEQEADAEKNYAISEFVEMPAEIAKIWANIPPEPESILDNLNPILDWIKNNAQQGDYVIVQGDYGATYAVVKFCFDNGFIPVYATTKRIVEETVLPDGSTKTTHIFKHIRFRQYQNLC